MTLRETLLYIQREFEPYSDSAEGEAYLLLEDLLGKSKAELVLAKEQSLTNDQLEVLELWLERRAEGEPLQYILGKSHFYGLELKVSPRVLIARPETEMLVDYVLKDSIHLDEPKFMDIGTGSGAIALALKHENPSASVIASDISEEALEVAKRNAESLQLSVDFVLADLLEHPTLYGFAKKSRCVGGKFALST